MKTQVALTSLFLAGPLYAHVPFVEGLDYQDYEAFRAQQPIEKSLALYNRFNAAGDQDRVIFTLTEKDFKDAKAVKDEAGQAGRRISFNTIVPACAPYAAVLPRVALIGPGQAALPPSSLSPSLPFTVNAEQGVFVLANAEQGAVFNEPIAGTRYFQQNSAELIVTVPGSYEVIVWEPQNRIADYVLVFGDEEIFGASEIVQSMKRIRYLRQGLEIQDENCRKEAKN